MARGPVVTRPRIEVFVRSLAPSTARQQQDAIVDRLRDYREAGRISDWEVIVSGGCVCPDAATATTGPGERLLSRYEAFTEWAEDRDRDLVGFDTRETKSMLTGTTVTGIMFPRTVLAEYRDGALTFVAPSRANGDETTVADRLADYDN